MATEIAAGAAAGTAIGAFILFFLLIWIAIFALGILAMIFWIFMIVDVAKRKFKESNEQVVWILVVVLTGIIGAIIYYLIVKKPNKH